MGEPFHAPTRAGTWRRRCSSCVRPWRARVGRPRRRRRPHRRSDGRSHVLESDIRLREPASPLLPNMGIAEQNMLSVAAGLGDLRLHSLRRSRSPASAQPARRRATEDAPCTRLLVPAITAASRWASRTSHHATEDLGLLRSIAKMTVVCPCDANSTAWALRTTVDLDGPSPGGREPEVYDERAAAQLEVGRLCYAARRRRRGDRRQRHHRCPAPLPPSGSRPSMVSRPRWPTRTRCPFDSDWLLTAARTGRLLVAEEHNVIGGIASAGADALVDGRVPWVLLFGERHARRRNPTSDRSVQALRDDPDGIVAAA